MAEPAQRQRRIVVPVALIAAGLVVTFLIDLAIQFPIGMTIAYALLVIAAMRTDRMSLVIGTAAASVVGILTAELIDHSSTASLTITETEHQVSRAFQVAGVVIIAVLGVADLRRRQLVARAHQERDSSALALEGTTARLREEQTRTAALAESIPSPVWLMSQDGSLAYANDAVHDYLGIDPVHLEEWLETVHPDDRDRVRQATLEGVTSRTVFSHEARYRNAAGDYRTHVVQAAPMKVGGITQWWSTAIDIEDLRSTQEQAARTMREHLETLQAIGDGVILLDHGQRITYVNPGACTILGRDRDALLHHTLVELYPYLEGTALERAFEEVVRTGHASHLVHYAKFAARWIDITIAPAPEGFTGYMTDVTAQRELERTREQATRLESIGQLTGGIAHDFNNLLTVIAGGAEALADDDLPAHSAEMRAMIAEAADRGAGLIRSLLAFARRQPLHPEPTSIVEAVVGMGPLLMRTLGDTIAVTVDIAENLPLVEVDRAKLDNAVLNLAINARDAMPSGGHLLIEARLSSSRADGAIRALDLPEGDYVRLSVTDTGVGIAPELLPRLFEPFFTTKPLGEGTGLGLAMVWGFASQSGGTLSVVSAPGEGSTFSLHLPAVAAASAAAPATRAPRPSAAGSTVLLVEDDALVRAVLARQLGGLGYTVVEASTAPQALSMLEDRPDIAIVITDFAMPGGMSGRELADHARATRPSLPVLCVSGYTEEMLLHAGELGSGMDFLAKPFTAEQLSAQLERLLGGDSPGTATA
ncbi:ATP-binding protein [Demequina capsici]|uniref:histidine kinase n=1 Tax=Demequina capsici TaxID=3075620 RepID=A0AA96JDL6_9MICO|nr:ATP-binding protein [Demequina sp. PMTSA13]WNM28216.1 ATP-binding protein [Demequina sp. PMTSA13]